MDIKFEVANKIHRFMASIGFCRRKHNTFGEQNVIVLNKSLLYM
jgi:hypothetical protein